MRSAPYLLVRRAELTLAAVIDDLRDTDEANYRGEFLKYSDVALGSLQANRIQSRAGAPTDEGSFMIFGGLNQYLDLCPRHGCLAVTVTPGGDIVHATPYRPNAIYAAAQTEGYPYEYIKFDPLADSRPIGIQRFPDGDLLVIFARTPPAYIFPFGTGVARVDPQGKPRWFRFDYSHHWPTLIDGKVLLIPATAIGDKPVSWTWPGGERYTLRCSSNKPYRDVVRVLDPDGHLKREISVLDAVLQSPHFGTLKQTTNGCDPLHLNYVDVIHDDVKDSIKGVQAGDLVVSLRNISAFGILDRKTGKLKRLVRGTFIQQHSVHHLSGSKFIMFDNLGGDQAGGTSRLLEVDLATGRERTIFPTAAATGIPHDLFSHAAGYLSISPDRKRAIVTFSQYGMAFEVRLSDGKVLRTFSNLQDVSHLDGFDENSSKHAAIFSLFGVNYAPSMNR